MGWPYVSAAIYAVGTIQSMIGQSKADKDQARAAEANATFFREQADFIDAAGAREQMIFGRQADDLISSQIGAIARSGVAFSGTMVQVMAQTEGDMMEESNAISADSDHRARIARLRAADAHNEAQAIRQGSTQRQLGIALSAVGQIAAFDSNTKKGKKRQKVKGSDHDINFFTLTSAKEWE
jgi:2-methylaconitate cis-trans-isomerase PrpF